MGELAAINFPASICLLKVGNGNIVVFEQKKNCLVEFKQVLDILVMFVSQGIYIR